MEVMISDPLFVTVVKLVIMMNSKSSKEDKYQAHLQFCGQESIRDEKIYGREYPGREYPGRVKTTFDLWHLFHRRPLWTRMELVYFQTPSQTIKENWRDFFVIYTRY